MEELFGTPLMDWKKEARSSLGLSEEKPIIIVGHQPEFFHPGVLAKFIAGGELAKQLGGELVHFVVDHHLGTSGTIQLPKEEEMLGIQHMTIARLDEQIAMKDQPRVESTHPSNQFQCALAQASGTNAAMQFASATDLMMSPWARVDHLLAGCDLLHTEIGKAILAEMTRDPQRCVSSYNEAIEGHEHCTIARLQQEELPLWQGKHNAKVGATFEDLRPRALLLTLLARLTIGDLCVHGIGGAMYDKVMERWLHNWLGVSPCPMVVATATVTLPLQKPSIEDARRQYFSPSSGDGKKQEFLESIDVKPVNSRSKHESFEAMHRWLSSIGTHPDPHSYKEATRTAQKRDWAFPIYPATLMDQLHRKIIQS